MKIVVVCFNAFSSLFWWFYFSSYRQSLLRIIRQLHHRRLKYFCLLCIQVFNNPLVASLPEHAHLIAEVCSSSFDICMHASIHHSFISFFLPPPNCNPAPQNDLPCCFQLNANIIARMFQSSSWREMWSGRN